jgi:hypothetical protein
MPENPLIRFLLPHLIGGFVGALAFEIVLLATDFAGLGTLVKNSADGPLVAALLFFGLFITFGSVAMGIGIMAMRRDDGDE